MDLLDLWPDPCLILDSSGGRLHLNPAARELGALPFTTGQTEVRLPQADGTLRIFKLDWHPITLHDQPAQLVFLRSENEELARIRNGLARRLQDEGAGEELPTEGLAERLDAYIEKRQARLAQLRQQEASTTERALELERRLQELRRQMAELAVGPAVDQEARRLAYEDPVTRLPNANILRRYLGHLSESVARGELSACILTVSLDLGVIRKTMGEANGDDLLQQVSQRMRLQLRPDDVLGRTGPDQLAAIVSLPVGHSEGSQAVSQLARTVSQRILVSLSQPFTVANQSVQVVGAVGVAMVSEASREDALRHAQEAARSGGPAHVHFYDGELEVVSKERAALANDLAEALAERQFCLRYQPIIELSKMKLAGAEALLRWNHGVLGVLEPSRFLDLAEEAGMLPALGDWIASEACNQFAESKSLLDKRLFVSMNLSARQVAQVDLARRIVDRAVRARFRVDNLVVEIEEPILSIDPDRLEILCQDLARRRVKVAIDNFGSGFCSVRGLQRCGVSMVKLDPSLVEQVATHSEAAKTCQALLGIAKALGLVSVAKGVETKEQALALKKMGCTLAQGHLFAPPLPGGNLAELTRASWTL